MSGPRIIRPVGSDRIRGAGAPDLDLADVREIGRQMLREARRRVRELEDTRQAVGQEMRALREAEEKAAAERRGALELELDATRAAALEHLERQREEALEDARREGLELGRRLGREEGYEEGRREGREAAIERLSRETEPVVASLQALLDEHVARRRELLEGARAGVIGLAMEVARRVVKREVRDFGHEVVAENVRRAVDLIFLRHRIVVQVHEDDIAAIEKFAPDVIERFSELEDFEMRPVKEIERGGCRILAGTGLVDLSLDVQLETIENALLGDLARTAEPSAADSGRGLDGFRPGPAAGKEVSS